MMAYAAIANRANFIDGILPDGQTVARLGLICTVYFRNGGQPATGQKVLACFDQFNAEFGQHLTGQLHSYSSRFSSLRKDSIAIARKKLEANTAEGMTIEWTLQSHKNGEIAPEYCISTLTANAESDPYGVLSYLKIKLPWQMLQEEAGEQQFLDWVRYLCEELDIEHGYAGLACELPFDRHQYQPYEFQIAQRFSGLMVDSAPHLDKSELKDGIKGVNWLTLLGPSFIEQADGETELCRQLALPDVRVEKTANGRLIIQAGLLPDVGGPERGHPPAYVAVNRVLKPIRVVNPDQLHTCMDDAEGFTKRNTLEWYARFDDLEAEPAVLAELTDAEQRCESERPCPRSGYWATPAKEDSRRAFERGEIMPDFPGSTYGATIWYWDENQD
ncbi:hypothetical protein BJP62_15895 [Jeongeupia sp. USM3]|nr:hypothetical protein BJP62_15895 [Jeongeupia sp. USM3]